MHRKLRQTVLCTAAMATVLPTAGAHAEGSVPARMSAEVSVQRGFLDAQGRPLAATIPPLRYRWERTRDGDRWKTTMTVLSPSTRPPATLSTGKSQDIPASISRLEDDGDGSPPRIYARDGRLIPGLDAMRARLAPPALPGQTELDAREPLGAKPTEEAGRRPASADAWLESVLPTRARAEERRARVEARFGASVGSVRGLLRFLRSDGEVTTETLLDPVMAVPVEVNTVRNGELESHTAYTYVAVSGGLLRQRMTKERRFAGEERGAGKHGAARMRMEIVLDKVSLGEGR